MLGRLIRFTVLILLAPMIYAFTHQAFLFLFDSGITYKSIQWFLLGFGLSILLYILLPSDRVRFWVTFEHELGHLITATMFLQKPSTFVVSPDQVNGFVVWQSGCGSTIILLAPYFLPLLTLPLLLLKPFLPPPFDEVANFLIGFTLAFHYTPLLDWEFRLHQPDFRKTGLIFSVVMAVFLNIVLLVLILGVVPGNYTGILDYFKNSWDRTVEAYKTAIDILQTGVIPAIREWLGR